MRHLLPPADDVSIIDVGCGTGGNIAALSRDYRGIGIDPSADAIEFASCRFPDVEFRCGRVPEVLDEAVDGGRRLFLLMDVLEHDESHSHYLRYDEARLRSTWTDLPLEEIMLSHFNARLYPLIRTIREFNRRSGRSFGDAGTDLKLPSRTINRLLQRLMAGEAGPLLRQLRQPQQRAYSRGVSLVAALRYTGRNAAVG